MYLQRHAFFQREAALQWIGKNMRGLKEEKDDNKHWKSNKSANPLTINDIHEKVSIAMSQTSVSVAELENEGLIECLNPQDKIGNLYRITTEGKEIITGLNNKQLE